eukprot:UN28519
MDGDGCKETCEPCPAHACQVGFVGADTNGDGCTDFCKRPLLDLRVKFGETLHDEQPGFQTITQPIYQYNTHIKIETLGFTGPNWEKLNIAMFGGWWMKNKPLLRSGLSCDGSCKATIRITGLTPN